MLSFTGDALVLVYRNVTVNPAHYSSDCNILLHQEPARPAHLRLQLALQIVMLHLDRAISGMLIANGNGFHAHMQGVESLGSDL
jgi:hypothetical protein